MAVVAVCAIGVALALALLWSSARAAITIARAEIHDGQLDVTRGHLPVRVLDDLRDVVARPPIKSATLRIVRDNGRAKMHIQGKVEPPQLQRLRNVIGNVPLARFAKEPRQ